MENTFLNPPEIKVSFHGSPSKIRVTTSRDAFDLLIPFYDKDRLDLQEQFIVLYLNQAHSAIGVLRLGLGGYTSVIADIRLILATGLKVCATSMLVSHNHPSGSLSPSDPDKRMTEKLVSAGKVHDISLVDHLIVTSSGYFSFADDGLMP